MRYKTPKALEQAVKSAAVKSDRDTNKAIAGFYHDRFLCRTFASSEPAFVLKGGQSMLAKIPNTRETRDVDLLGLTPDLDEALSVKPTAWDSLVKARDLGPSRLGCRQQGRKRCLPPSAMRVYCTQNCGT